MATFYTRPEIAQQTVVQAPDPLEAQSKYLAVRNQQQQGQMQGLQLQQTQQEMADQQKVRDAFQQAGGDWDKTFEIAAKSGISPSTLSKLDAARLDHKQKLAAATKEEREAYVKKSEIAAAAARSFMELRQHDPAQAQATYTQLKPQLEQQLGVKLPDQIPSDSELQFQASLSEKTLKDMREAETQAAELPGKKADSEKKVAEAASMKESGGMTKEAAESKYLALQQKIAGGFPISPPDKNFLKAYEKQKLLVPATTTQLRIDGMGKIRQFPVYDSVTKQTVYMDSNEINDAKLREPGRYTVPQYTPEQVGAKATTTYFTEGKGGQQLNAFNTAIVHLNTLERLAKDLNNTDIQIVNRAKQEWAKQTGAPAPANFAAAKNAMSGEVAAALKASGATDQEIAKVSETFDKAQSEGQIVGAINTYRELLHGKRDQLKKQYDSGMKGKPAFSDEPQQHAPGAEANLPDGKTGTGSDGKKYIVKGGVWVPQ